MNPYQVLGVAENASDEQVRSAYLALVKKYHPDKYQDNPLKELAGEKLKEINEAYDIITKQRANGGYNHSSSGTGSTHGYGTGNNYGYGGAYANAGYGAGYGGAYTGEYANEFNRVRQFLNNNSIHEARAVLENIPTRNAEWNYLYGIALFRMGEYSAARNYLEMAVQLDPNNNEYRSAYNTTVARGGRSYHTYERSGSGGTDMNTVCSVCQALYCADCCCECMGGDLIRCC